MPLASAQEKVSSSVLSAIEWLHQSSFEEAVGVYCDFLNDSKTTDDDIALLASQDRFFLLRYILNRKDVENPWLYDRCREVEAESDGCLDLWARGHYKSTIITYAGSIQEIINDPEITIGIFSHNRAIAKSFLIQIKQECETNLYLQRLYPHIFWDRPKRDAPIWSLDYGIVLKRASNPKEATVEAWGLVDSQPTAKHFMLMIYDDVVTQGSVYTPGMIIKTTESWELSRHLSSVDSLDNRRTWYIGTRYSFADTYRVMLDREVAKPRLHPATDNGLPDGKPIFLSEADWEKKKRENSPYTLACQMLLNPIAGSEQELKPEWIRRYEVRPETLNIAILVDPANSQKKSSSNTAMAVLGIDSAYNKYLLDGACHKMNLAKRWEMLKYLRHKWIRQPGVQAVMVGYEKYGMQADIDHFKQMMEIEKLSFPIEEVSWTRRVGEQAKDDRIRRLIPDHRNWQFFYPYEGDETSAQAQAVARKKGYLVAKPIKRKNQDGKIYNLVEWFIQNEYLFFPATNDKDFLDAMSRVYDVSIGRPGIVKEEDLYPEYEGDW